MVVGVTLIASAEPVKVTDWGLVGSPSTIDRLPLREPPDVGVYTTVTEQEELPARELLQELALRTKSCGSAPMTLRGLMDRVAVLRLEIVIVLAAPLFPTLTVPKLIEVGLTLMAVNPVPVTLSVSGLLLSLPGIFMVADSVPTVVGVNTTVYVHEPLTGMLCVHKFVVKSPPLAPVNVTGFRVSGAVPILVTVTLKGLLADSNTVPVKARL
jgi:hypothetical protein